MKQINARLIRIARERTLDGSSIFDLDREFHRLIVNAGAGARLMTLHHAIEPQTERYWRLYASSIINNLTTSTEEHDAIIKALVAGDPDGLEEALKLNWENGCKRLARGDRYVRRTRELVTAASGAREQIEVTAQLLVVMLRKYTE